MCKRSAVLFVCLFCCLMRDMSAQAPVGTVTGTVTDSTGAVLPSATISITNKATSVARTLTANEGGLYSAPALAPGDYEVRAVAASTVMTSGVAPGVMVMSTVVAATAQINYETYTVAGVI